MSRTAIATLSATILVLILTLVFSSSSRVFCMEHPGIVLVAIAVIGELACEWKREKTFQQRLKKFFALLLVAGLLLEIGEAIKSDKEVGTLKLESAEAKKQAGLANERTSKSEVGRLELEKQVLKLVEKTRARSISSKARADLALKLKGVPMGNVEIVMSDRDAECLAFGIEIKKSLISAGFLNVDFSPRDVFRAVEMFPQLAGSGTDLVLCVKDAKSPPLCAAITLLCFRGDGVSADGWPYNAVLGTNDFQIWVLPKPIHPVE